MHSVFSWFEDLLNKVLSIIKSVEEYVRGFET